MKIVCQKADLLNGVNIVSKAVPSSTTMSILECILIDTSEDKIELIGNDTELGIRTVIEGNIEKKGKIAIEAKMLNDVVRKLPDNEVSIEIDENMTANIKCGKSKFNIPCKSGDDFTVPPEIEKNGAVTISQLTLRDLIRQTTFSIGLGDNNKVMSGVHLLINNDILKFTSLDGHRISIRKVQLKNVYDDKEAIIPGKTLNEISKILNGGAEDDVNIFITENHILFELENTIIVSRLIEGTYFNVDKMMSSDYETKININKKNLYDCIDRSMLFSKEGNKKPIVVSINDEKLRLIVNSPLGSMDEEISIEKTGKDINIGFNPKFVIDALKVIDEESVDIYFVNSKSPCYIKDENENYIYLILPVNLNSSNY